MTMPAGAIATDFGWMYPQGTPTSQMVGYNMSDPWMTIPVTATPLNIILGGDTAPTSITATYLNQNPVSGAITTAMATNAPAALWQEILSGAAKLATLGLSALVGTQVAQVILGFFQSASVKAAIAALTAWAGAHWLWLAAGLVAAGLLSWVIYKWLKGGKRRRRRMSIGANPRLGTLIKVAKRCDKLTTKFGNRMRHAGIMRTRGRSVYYGSRNGRKDLTIVR